MDLTREDHLDPAKRHLHYGDYAPLEVFAAMIALQDPAKITASVVARADVDGGTTWRAAWLAGTRLTVCEAHRADRAGWSMDLSQPFGTVEATVDAWSADLGEVEALRVTSARAGGQNGGMGAMADVVWSVKAPGGRSFTVPLSGDFPHHTERESCETFMAALRAAMDT